MTTESLRVLLVDDEPETLRLVRKILQSDGHAVVEAVDGKEALDLFHKERPDLILLDIIIPQIDGIEVLKRIRTEDTVTGIIMVSALTSEKLAVEAMVNGADDYVSKPFPLKEIRVRINQAAVKAKLRRENQKLQRQLAAAEEKLQNGTPAGPAEAASGQREVTILTVDLGDVAMAVKMLPVERQVATLDQYLSIISKAVEGQESLLHHLAGNAVIAVFANESQRHSSESAAQAALDIRSSAAKLAGGGQPLRLSLHTGPALVARIGKPPIYAAVGEGVQMAFHLSQAAEPGDILISQDSFAHLHHRMQMEPCGEIPPPAGLSTPLSVYRLTGPSAA